MTDQYASMLSPVSGANDVNAFRFAFRRLMASVRTTTLAKVVKVTTHGEVGPVGFIDVQPLVSQTDGAGKVYELPVLYGVPYCRLQGGTNAVIIDPAVGDVGVIGFGDRDLSAAIAAKDVSPPGSNRRHALSDAIWLCGLLNAAPVQYVQFTDSGIVVHSPTKVTVSAPTILLDGALTVTGAQTNNSTITASGDVKGAGTSLHTHVHGGVQSGSSSTAPPT